MEAQYLRARWYDVATGRFTSEDVWEGDKYQPLTLHAYLYALAAPINLADASGMRPQPDSTYSCNCGFIDEAHLDDNPDSMASKIIQFVENSTIGDQWSYQLPNGKCFGSRCVGQITDIAVRIKEHLAPDDRPRVALGIFQALENGSEEGKPQTWTGSRYSEEDLTSNLLGFYRALGGRYTRENIEEWCDFLDEVQSAEIYRWYVRYMGPAKVSNWGAPRLLTCADRLVGCGWLNDCSVCPLDEYCPGERGFPVDEFNLVPDPEGGKWELVEPIRVRWPIPRWSK